MKLNCLLPELNLKSFYGFTKLTEKEKTTLLREQGIMLDVEREKDTSVRLYFLNGFFVEETVSLKDNTILDILPFRRGYKLDSYVEVKEVIAPKFSY